MAALVRKVRFREHQSRPVLSTTTGEQIAWIVGSQELRKLPAPAYGWFSEGFDTRDLKEAKALLEELAA